MKALIILAVAMTLLSCAQAATMVQLNEKAPVDEFTVNGGYICLYNAGADFLSQYHAILFEAPFMFNRDDLVKEGYFRQPHTIIRIKHISDNESLITRATVMHTDNMIAHQVLRFLRENPCK